MEENKFLKKYLLLEQEEEFVDFEDDQEDEIEKVNLSDEELLDLIVEFLLSLEDDQLEDEQLEQLHTILSALDENGTSSELEDEMSEARFYKKTPLTTRRKGRMYYRRHKNQIKKRLRRLMRKIKMMRKRGRGLSGKKLGRFKRRH
jgi:hypothetical protein